MSKPGRTAVPLDLRAGSFLDQTSKAAVGTGKVTFSLEAGGGKIPAELRLARAAGRAPATIS